MLSFASEREYQKWLNGTRVPGQKPKHKPRKPAKIINIKPRCTLHTLRAEFVFAQIHPSTNQYMRWHWTKRADEVTQWHWLVKQALGGRKIHIENPVIETIYKFPDRRERDRGNYIPKFLIDALVKEGVIKDDNSNELTETMPIFEFSADNPGMFVILKEKGAD